MKYQIAFVLLAILSINFVSIIAYEYDEYYCRNHPYYQICHQCKDVDEICDRQEQGCHCDNIAIFHDAKRKCKDSLKGVSNQPNLWKIRSKVK